MLDVVGVGFAILDRIYVGDRLVAEELGGTCGNVVSNLACLGHGAGALLRLGDDRAGEAMVRGFEAAGASTALIAIARGVRSPIIAQVNRPEREHAFTFTCPETGEPYPRAVAADAAQVEGARAAIAGAKALFADRLSGPILTAMKIAAAAGTLVYLEPDPDTIEDGALFAEALRLADVAKFSGEKFPGFDPLGSMRRGAVAILTRGAEGLDVRTADAALHLPATPADPFVDASGSGDCVTTGALDAVVGGGMGHRRIDAPTLAAGIAAGQRLAAANCAHAGARGLYARTDRAGLRAIMADRAP